MLLNRAALSHRLLSIRRDVLYRPWHRSSDFATLVFVVPCGQVSIKESLFSCHLMAPAGVAPPLGNFSSRRISSDAFVYAVKMDLTLHSNRGRGKEECGQLLAPPHDKPSGGIFIAFRVTCVGGEDSFASRSESSQRYPSKLGQWHSAFSLNRAPMRFGSSLPKLRVPRRAGAKPLMNIPSPCGDDTPRDALAFCHYRECGNSGSLSRSL